MPSGIGWTVKGEDRLVIDNITYKIEYLQFDKVIIAGPDLDKIFDAHRAWEDIISEIRSDRLRQKCI